MLYDFDKISGESGKNSARADNIATVHTIRSVHTIIRGIKIRRRQRR
uniref:Uncharacterized protein n=1 Tax=uncultured bacterium contig00031 TaxID=1181520 RepID=A0A806K0A7_9BACT|nr:hypothetical protein [uncultured bacterium contig00031]